MEIDLRPDLNGLRVRLPGTFPIYLIDQGKRRHIPSEDVYNFLFSTWDGIVDDIDIVKIQLGEPIPSTADLVRFLGRPAIFLKDGVQPNHVLRHITSPEVMERYKFNWANVWDYEFTLEAFQQGQSPHFGLGPEITNP